MDNSLNTAEYMVMLATNSVSDTVRDIYFSNIDQYNSCIDSLELILRSVLKGIDNNTLSSEDAINLIKNEYNNSIMSKFLVDFTGIIEFATKLIDARNHEYGTATIDDLKAYIDIADKLDERISMSIYHAILNRLVISRMVLEDINFSKKIMDRVKNCSSVNDNKTFFDIIHDTLNRI